jgi:hypothetical protein
VWSSTKLSLASGARDPLLAHSRQDLR